MAQPLREQKQYYMTNMSNQIKYYLLWTDVKRNLQLKVTQVTILNSKYIWKKNPLLISKEKEKIKFIKYNFCCYLP